MNVRFGFAATAIALSTVLATGLAQAANDSDDMAKSLQQGKSVSTAQQSAKHPAQKGKSTGAHEKNMAKGMSHSDAAVEDVRAGSTDSKTARQAKTHNDVMGEGKDHAEAQRQSH
ncbi:hypothetical protein [Niveibacterium sp.]|uniref:hypothetical protein n=1 Tax=Niveibacterium sp. TaxID=2017444 RepID=UPI0035AF81AC